MSNFEIYVDWNADGDFSDSNEDITGDTISANWNLGRRPFVNVADEARLTVVVSNADKKYSPENASGALYGNLLPGRIIQVEDGSSNIMWKGLISEIIPDPIPIHGGLQATIKATMLRPYMKKFRPRLDLYEDVTVDVVLDDIFDQFNHPFVQGMWKIGIPGLSELGETTVVGGLTSVTDIDLGLTVLNWFGDNVNQTDNEKGALEIIQMLVDAERGYVWFDREGVFVFRNRQHYMSGGYTPDVTFNDTAHDIDYAPPGNKYLFNDIEVKCYPRNEGSSTTLWTNDNDITISPGDTLDLTLPYHDDRDTMIGGKNVSQPSPTYSSGSAAINNFTAAAQYAIMQFENTGGVDAVISSLDVTGNAITSRNPVIITAKDYTSMQDYGQRTLTLDLKALDDIDVAKSVAEFELLMRSQVIGIVTTVTVEKEADGTENANQLTYGIDDIVRVVDSQTGHDRNYFIVGEEHSVNSSNQHETKWILEPTPAISGFWILGDAESELGTNTGLGY